jgi:KUP system potassium uptake protein
VAVSSKRNAALAFAALGVVFGDIGTSPLYTLRTCFTTAHVLPTAANTIGIASLLVWALVAVVCVKYVAVLMRVDHDGEGGILALLALTLTKREGGLPAPPTWLTGVVVLGAAMLFGDGIITPAISVVSAVEGLQIATPAAQPFVVPVAIAILVGLFAIQARGTERVGRLFAPAMLVWFAAIAVAGLVAIVREPAILAALDPRQAAAFALGHGAFGFLVFGAIVLAVTGVEALYADLSHFGRAPIAAAWYVVVFPALILTYLGEGARLIADRAAFDNPFFALAPGPLLVPMVILATVATIIASQALISGAFTLAEQAINLSLWPRLIVVHTSRRQRGQVYVPSVNAFLAVACVLLVASFRSSDRLASAYGLAVSATMFATSVAFVRVAGGTLGWNRSLVAALAVPFFALDGTFVAASLPKLLDGAWVPLAISAVFLVASLTWLEGRRCVARSLARSEMPIARWLREVPPADGPPTGTMVFLTRDPSAIPFVGTTHRWVRARAREEHVVILSLVRAMRPYVRDGERVAIETVAPRLTCVRAAFGYMERPSIVPILASCEAAGLHIDSDETSFFYADPKIVPARERPLPAWMRGLFAMLSRNARPLTDELDIRPERRVELGVEVAI